MQKQEYRRIEQLEEIHFWYRAMETSVLDYLNRRRFSGAKILDAGCGNGGLSRKLQPFGIVTALDINDTAIRLAKEKGLKKVIKASVERLPFADESFDIVLSLDVLYHKKVKDDEKALREAKRVLKTGGLLILRLPAFEILRGHHDVIVETRHRYVIGEVRKKVINAGFEIEKISYANFLLSIPLLLKRNLERILKSDSDASDTVELPGFLNEFFFNYLAAENKLLNYFNYPFGSSIICYAVKKS